MERVRLTSTNIEGVADRAADALRSGGVVLYPTDTLYGLGADAFSDEAVGKIYDIKGREEGKLIHAIVANVEMAGRYGEVNDLGRALVRELPPGKVTLIVCKKQDIDSGICRAVSTFGFRIPDNEFCLKLLRSFGGPITATSANKSGETPPRDIKTILAQFGEGAKNIDLAVDAGRLPAGKPSTVVDLTSPEPVILREGAVSAADVWEAIDTRY
ncbi:threonylcarbamoyl-AMP synthase [Candidatus Kaiserbacteria bacterium]|nr:threonylcarbamoyl-AMP synthase [Candidatus Kaiserbacteria bacterium]